MSNSDDEKGSDPSKNIEDWDESDFPSEDDIENDFEEIDEFIERRHMKHIKEET